MLLRWTLYWTLLQAPCFAGASWELGPLYCMRSDRPAVSSRRRALPMRHEHSAPQTSRVHCAGASTPRSPRSETMLRRCRVPRERGGIGWGFRKSLGWP